MLQKNMFVVVSFHRMMVARYLRSSPVAKFQEKFYKEHKDAWMMNVIMNLNRNHGTDQNPKTIYNGSTW